MSKIIDITDKLNFEQKPQIKIKDTVITVNDEAVILLEILPKLSSNPTPEDIDKICKSLFEQSEHEKIKALKLNFKDFTTLIELAIEIIVGEEEPGEAVTLATT